MHVLLLPAVGLGEPPVSCFPEDRVTHRIPATRRRSGDASWTPSVPFAFGLTSRQAVCMSQDSRDPSGAEELDLGTVAAAEIVRRLRLAPKELLAVRNCIRTTTTEVGTEIEFTPSGVALPIEPGLPEACQLADVDSFVDNVVADLKEHEARFGETLPWATA